MQKFEMIFATPFDMHDPEFVQAAQLLEREGLVKGVHVIGNDETRPPGGFYVFPRGQMERSQICSAVEIVTRKTLTVARDDKEVPMISEEFARGRGFTDAEIEPALKPWIQSSRDAADAAVKQAQAALEVAVTDRDKVEKMIATKPEVRDGMVVMDAAGPGALENLDGTSPVAKP